MKHLSNKVSTSWEKRKQNSKVFSQKDRNLSSLIEVTAGTKRITEKLFMHESCLRIKWLTSKLLKINPNHTSLKGILSQNNINSSCAYYQVSICGHLFFGKLKNYSLNLALAALHFRIILQWYLCAEKRVLNSAPLKPFKTKFRQILTTILYNTLNK